MPRELHLSAVAQVRRTAKGDTISLSLITNGVPLFQGLQPATVTVSPAWTAESHPVITPRASSAQKNAAVLTNHVWEYNGKNLGFKMTGDGWET